MVRLASFRLGVERGSTVLFSDFEDGGEMWSGSGPRQRRQAIRFSETYDGAPVVQVGLAMWDIESSANLRADIQAENVTRRGFDIVFRTWGDTRVARIRASWLAIGELRDDEKWDI